LILPLSPDKLLHEDKEVYVKFTGVKFSEMRENFQKLPWFIAEMPWYSFRNGRTEADMERADTASGLGQGRRSFITL
jgi:hypothetical protein